MCIAAMAPQLSGNGGTVSTPKYHYFIGGGENWVFSNGYYGMLTIEYDGEKIYNNYKISNRGGVGGYTTGKRQPDSNISVKLELYRESDKQLITTMQWSGKLSSNRQGINLRYTPPGASYWAMDGSLFFRTDGFTNEDRGTIRVRVN